jgi:hypothetical protein
VSALTSPDYAGGCIVNLTASVLDAFGVDPPNPVCRHLHGDTLRGDGGIVLLICDALGFRQFETALRSGRTPNLRRLVELAAGGLQSLTSVFPSTTTVALTSLNTASTPAQHGMLGQRQWIEEVGALCNMLRFTTEEAAPAAFSEELVRVVPTVYDRLAVAGIPSFSISASEYEGSSFTSLISSGSTYVGYRAQSEISHLLASSIGAAGGGRGFYSIYWPMIDTLSHLYGPDASDTQEVCLSEMDFIDLMVGKVMEVCERNGQTLIVTADHGQTRLAPDRALTLGGDVAALLRHPPGGGRRALYLSSQDPTALASLEVFQTDDVLLLTADEAVNRGWYGGDCAPFRARLGDLIALAQSDRQLLFDYGSGVHLQTGAHAGLSEDEMLVPLVAVPFG